MAIVLAVAGSGCAVKSSSQWDRQPQPAALPSAGPVFVMEPIVIGSASPGNSGRDFAAINAKVTERILSIVQERFPRAQVADSRPSPIFVSSPAYQLATGENFVTAEETNAASDAVRRGATHLLVPSITEWTQMRTDDPIGAFILPHNRITLVLRLMRLDPPALAGRVTFSNRASLTLNQEAARLMNERFRQAVLRLLAG
jgi:hypothetical protein